MWTEREIAIAQQLQEPATQAFLKKVLVDTATNNGEVLASNIVALDDAAYGRVMKVVYFSREENKAKLNLIAKIAKMKVEAGENKLPTHAPR